MTPGGGGFGDPLDRDIERVRQDVALGYVSVEAAARDYGVVLAGGIVDEAATLSRRASLRASREPLRAFSFGPERDAWDSVFDDASMLELNALLMRLGSNERSQRRQAIFEAVVPRLHEAGAIAMHELIGGIDAARTRLAMEIAGLSADIAGRDA
jgi:N-methylhydantoinase B